MKKTFIPGVTLVPKFITRFMGRKDAQMKISTIENIVKTPYILSKLGTCESLETKRFCKAELKLQKNRLNAEESYILLQETLSNSSKNISNNSIIQKRMNNRNHIYKQQLLLKLSREVQIINSEHCLVDEQNQFVRGKVFETIEEYLRGFFSVIKPNDNKVDYSALSFSNNPRNIYFNNHTRDAAYSKLLDAHGNIEIIKKKDSEV